jgi:hypothetical protein
MIPPMDPIASEMREEAEFYASIGLSCFPLRWGAKVPEESWKPYQKRRPPPEELRALFRRRMNIAIPTGFVDDAGLNLVFVDLDSPQALHEARGRFPPTPIVTETRRGLQLGFRHPSEPVPNRVKAEGLFDVRGDGGYVVAPPSLHPSGVRYRRLGDWLAGNIPTFDPTWLPPREEVKKATRASTPLVRSPDLDRVRRYLDKADIAVSGRGGHRQFFAVCCRTLRAFPWLTWDQFVDAMTYYSDHRSDPPWTPKEILHKCQDSWRKERA